ncbi:MAG TPA: MBL fold metallo-hydrolase [Thermoplasmata archaeon]|nr:MBL fold metallo-hydrolase [Thermoplasmata archaeon]
MELQFLGGASEIGSLGLVVRDSGRTLLFDYGMTPTDPPQYPRPAPLNVDAAFLSHAHLDHSGMTPLLSRLPRARIVATPVTAAVTDLLTRDSLKVAKMEGYLEPYTTEDIRALNSRFEVVPLKSAYRRQGIEVELHAAGHIPGASMFLYRGDHDVLFTGDLSALPSRLVGGASTVECDVLAMESTYAGREHPDRKLTEERLRQRIDEVLEDGGRVLIPAFAVGRAQEVILALAQSGLDVWLDGMARKVNDIYRSAPEALRDSRKFHRAIESVHIVEHSGERRHALREAEVIVTTGGMLDGGPVLYYLAEMYRDPHHAIFLTGYQVEGSNGRQLVEQGTITIDEVTVRPACQVEAFDFSSHAGHSELVAFAKSTNASKVILMHGDQRPELARSLSEFTEVQMPQNGERFTL